MAELQLVSIGMAVYNRPEYIEAAVQSVVNQDYEGMIELIITDDGSDDPNVQDTLYAVSKCSNYRRSIHVCHNVHAGLSAAHSNFQSQLKGTYAAILDSDDTYAPSFVSSCVEYLETHKEVDLTYVDSATISTNGRVLDRHITDEWNEDLFLNTRFIRSQSCLYRVQGVFDKVVYEPKFKYEADYHTYYQLLRRNRIFARVPKVLYHYRTHDKQLSADRKGITYEHAACLAKFGYSIQYAYVRAISFNKYHEWLEIINSGYSFGRTLKW